MPAKNPHVNDKQNENENEYSQILICSVCFVDSFINFQILAKKFRCDHHHDFFIQSKFVCLRRNLIDAIRYGFFFFLLLFVQIKCNQFTDMYNLPVFLLLLFLLFLPLVLASLSSINAQVMINTTSICCSVYI